MSRRPATRKDANKAHNRKAPIRRKARSSVPGQAKGRTSGRNKEKRHREEAGPVAAHKAALEVQLGLHQTSCVGNGGF